jgi:DNA repair ATPase RecN
VNDRAKKRLKQIKWLDAQIDGLIQDLADAQAKATKVTSAISPAVVSRSTDPDQLEAGVMKIIELKKQINQKIDEFVDRKREMESIIEKVEDADQVKVLRKRYFEYKSWEQIAVEVGCKYRNVHYIHGDALKVVEALLKDGEENGRQNIALI